MFRSTPRYCPLEPNIIKLSKYLQKKIYFSSTSCRPLLEIKSITIKSQSHHIKELNQKVNNHRTKSNDELQRSKAPKVVEIEISRHNIKKSIQRNRDSNHRLSFTGNVL